MASGLAPDRIVLAGDSAGDSAGGGLALALLAARWRGFGADVSVQVTPDAPHVWQMFGFLPEAGAALGRVADFLQGVAGAAEPSSS